MNPVLTDYLFAWQIPVGLVFIAAWVYGGGRILLWVIRRQSPGYKVRLGQCAVVSLLAGAAGMVGAGVMILTGATLSRQFGASFLYPYGAIVLGAIAFMALSYLVIFAMFEMPTRQSVISWAATFGIITALAAAMAGPTYYFTVHVGRESRLTDLCQKQLWAIYEQIQRYEELFGYTPDNLQQLVDKKFVPPQLIFCPVSRERNGQYFYFKPNTVRELPSNAGRQILICDFRSNHRNEKRNVLMLDGTLRKEPYSPAEFKALLAEPQNAEFAKALRQAEGDE